MNSKGEISGRDVTRLLDSVTPVDTEVEELGRFLRDFEAAYPEPSVEHCESAHLAAIFAAAQQLAPADDSVPARPGQDLRLVAPASPRGVGSTRWTGLGFPRWVGVKLAIPVAAILLAFGGVALAGGLVYHEATTSPPVSTGVTQPAPSPSGLGAFDEGRPGGTGIGQDDQDSADDQDNAGDEDKAGKADEAVMDGDEQDDADDGDEAAIEQDEQGVTGDADEVDIEDADEGDTDQRAADEPAESRQYADEDPSDAASTGEHGTD